MSLHTLLRCLVMLCVGVLLSNCGSSPSNSANTITIANYTYTPSNLSVPAGTTVTVVNRDGTNHSLTSQSALGNYTPGAVNSVQFDTGPFAGTANFTISSTAQVGTVIPYFCTVHKATMGMGQGQITVTGP